jgi:nicotinamidase/pyrazinamidase
VGANRRQPGLAPAGPLQLPGPARQPVPAPRLRTERFHTIWRKGYLPNVEAYAVTAQHPGFAACLWAAGVHAVVVCGLATNICCFYAARDLRAAGFRVLLVEDASAGIDVPAAGLFQEKTRAEGQRLGIKYTTVAEVVREDGRIRCPT